MPCAELPKKSELILDCETGRCEIQVLIFARRRSHQDPTHEALCPREIFPFIVWVACNVPQERCAAYCPGPDDLRCLSFTFTCRDKVGQDDNPHRTSNCHDLVRSCDLVAQSM